MEMLQGDIIAMQKPELKSVFMEGSRKTVNTKLYAFFTVCGNNNTIKRLNPAHQGHCQPAGKGIRWPVLLPAAGLVTQQAGPVPWSRNRSQNPTELFRPQTSILMNTNSHRPSQSFQFE